MIIVPGSARVREVRRGFGIFSFALSSRSVRAVTRLSGGADSFFSRRSPGVIR